ncbi:MAG: NADH-quinone oxidoreductase subunit NuoE [Kibdelosporangium sp.]
MTSGPGQTYGGSSVGGGPTHQSTVDDSRVAAVVSPLGPEATAKLVSEVREDLTVFDGIVERARAIVLRYPQSRSALLPMLHLVQSVQGYVSQAGIQFCARELELAPAEVSAVATFYTMYKRKPCGEHLVSVCTNTLCAALGGDAIYQTLREHLGEPGKPLGHEETVGTPGEPGSVTVEHAECLAACDLGPVLQVNYEYYDNQTPESAVELVDALRRGDKPAPTRGAPLTDFKDASLQLAGFFERPSDVDGPSAATETRAGAALAADRAWTAPAMPANVAFPDLDKK